MVVMLSKPSCHPAVILFPPTTGLLLSVSLLCYLNNLQPVHARTTCSTSSNHSTLFYFAEKKQAARREPAPVIHFKEPTLRTSSAATHTSVFLTQQSDKQQTNKHPFTPSFTKLAWFLRLKLWNLKSKVLKMFHLAYHFINLHTNSERPSV